MSDAVESSLATVADDRQALEAFVVENADLEALEGLLEQFNIFEAVGVVRQELRHSDFLAFLLDPRQNHRLGDVFVRRFLQRVLLACQHLAPPLSPIHLDSWDLSRMVVRREWRNIDLLLVDQSNRLVVVIENKIGSTEGIDQLKRYLNVVNTEYPDSEWHRLAIYLTPEGATPSASAYLPADYGLVADTVEAIARSRKPTLDPATYGLMVHYAQMLRRHIVTDSEIADLCQRIYQRHKRALDLIFEHRPDRQAEVQKILINFVQSHPDLIPDYSGKGYIRFGHKAWEPLPKGTGWTRSGRMLLFQFDNRPDRLDLALWVGPGPTEVRNALIDLASVKSKPFRVVKRSPRWDEKWRQMFSHPFLRPEDHDDASMQEIEARLRTKWDEFVTRDLPLLVAPIQEAIPSIVAMTEPTEASVDSHSLDQGAAAGD